MPNNNLPVVKGIIRDLDKDIAAKQRIRQQAVDLLTALGGTLEEPAALPAAEIPEPCPPPLAKLPPPIPVSAAARPLQPKRKKGQRLAPQIFPPQRDIEQAAVAFVQQNPGRRFASTELTRWLTQQGVLQQYTHHARDRVYKMLSKSKYFQRQGSGSMTRWKAV